MPAKRGKMRAIIWRTLRAGFGSRGAPLASGPWSLVGLGWSLARPTQRDLVRPSAKQTATTGRDPARPRRPRQRWIESLIARFHRAFRRRRRFAVSGRSLDMPTQRETGGHDSARVSPGMTQPLQRTAPRLLEYRKIRSIIWRILSTDLM